MSSIPVNTQSSRSAVGWGRVLRAGLLATVAAVVVNIVVYFIASALGAMPQDVITPMGQPINLQAVLTMSVMAGLGATIVYGILTRLTSNPVRWFYIAAAIVFLFMFFSPFSLPGVTTAQIVALEVMHLTTAVALVGVLTTRARPE
jgi:hypothetical protein